MALPNKFPALNADAPLVYGTPPYLKSTARGVCEVIIESRKHYGDFHNLPLEQVAEYVELLGKRSFELGALSFIKQVVPFKNKGRAIGVSMIHPHSQIYATPFVPPRIRHEVANARRYEARHGHNIFATILERELKDGVRVVYRNREFTLFVPAFAMWPYETHIYSSRPFRSLSELSHVDSMMLADALRVATATYRGHFGRAYAYMLVFHQAPTKAETREFRFHAEIYSPQIGRGRVKFAAGIEWGAGTFTYDGVPEQRALELKETAVKSVQSIEHLGHVGV